MLQGQLKFYTLASACGEKKKVLGVKYWKLIKYGRNVPVHISLDVLQRHYMLITTKE